MSSGISAVGGAVGLTQRGRKSFAYMQALAIRFECQNVLSAEFRVWKAESRVWKLESECEKPSPESENSRPSKKTRVPSLKTRDRVRKLEFRVWKLESECEKPSSESEEPSLRAKNTNYGVSILCYLISDLAETIVVLSSVFVFWYVASVQIIQYGSNLITF